MYILIILRMMTSFEPSKQKTPSSLEGSGGLKNNRKILFYHIWEENSTEEVAQGWEQSMFSLG